MKVWNWLKDYWLLPATILGILIAWARFGWRDPRNVTEKVRTELRAIRAKQHARDLQLQHGQEEAVQKILEEYRAREEAISEERLKRIEELHHDPEQLADLLARLTE